MFNNIRAKILTMTLIMLFVLLSVFAVSTYLYYRDTKNLMIEYASKNIAIFAQNINKETVKIEKNARDLAIMGELYYRFDRNPIIAQKTMEQVFKNFPDSLGGGIWFKPYIVYPNQKYSCIYLYRNKLGSIVRDYNFDGDAYDYLNQVWYKEIVKNLSRENDIAWTSPYYEKEGSNTLMITAGSGIYDEQDGLVGISTVDWAINSVLDAIENIKPTPNSFALFANPEKDYIIVSTDEYLDNDNLIGKSLKNIPWYNANLINITYITYHGKKYIPFVKTLDNGMVLIVCIPKWELFDLIFKSVVILSLILTIITFSVAYYLYAGLRANILNPISKLNFIANKISKGDTDIEIKIEKPEEFARLASTFDKMTKDIKNITKERERINSELAIAKSIQTATLPEITNIYPNRKEFDIYASMDAAKEVGGDFYDFYFTDENHFMFLIADVSGKGIPAALFMMTAKTHINNLSLTISNPEELIFQINNKIYSNNKQGLFITMFAGIVDIKTGKMFCVNCGHNPPLIKQNNGDFKYLDCDSNMVLGVFENTEFKIFETTLNEGDVLYTYTDGVTEALNSDENVYGEERLLSCINANKNCSIQEITENIKKDLDEYIASTPQSDDITMLIFKYNGSGQCYTECFKDYANKDNYKEFYSWLLQICKDWDLDDEITNKLDMCGEEIYANIEFYAYPQEQGFIEVTMSKIENKKIVIQFKDSGVEYNPLEKADPNINLPPEERPLGGLGIYMVKQMADEIEYKRADNNNILTITLYI